VNMAGIIQHAIRGSALERLTPWQQAGAVLCLVPAGYANLNGPLPTADTAVMQIRAVKHRNLGHLIRTWGGGTLMGLGYIRWGGITINQSINQCYTCSYEVWPPSGIMQPIACRGGGSPTFQRSRDTFKLLQESPSGRVHDPLVKPNLNPCEEV
jgi:hypothetical protein